MFQIQNATTTAIKYDFYLCDYWRVKCFWFSYVSFLAQVDQTFLLYSSCVGVYNKKTQMHLINLVDNYSMVKFIRHYNL